MNKIFPLIIFSFIFSNSDHCYPESLFDTATRSIYSIGDTLTMEDQNRSFSVCHSNGNYELEDSFTFADYNGDLNGGDYKITIISMNATW